jgi:hypothetical protein
MWGSSQSRTINCRFFPQNPWRFTHLSGKVVDDGNADAAVCRTVSERNIKAIAEECLK